jgi:CO/xanthine dehydrogenase FAD-binding subunit
MKPVLFDYIRPESATETVALLARHARDAKLLAGGQNLVPLLNF